MVTKDPPNAVSHNVALYKNAYTVLNEDLLYLQM
jgi:hypothetical protein